MEMTRYLRAPSFDEAAVRRAFRFRDQDGRRDLVGAQRDLARPQDEIRQSQPALAAAADQLDLRAERQQRRHAVRRRRGVAQVAADGAAILDLPPADLARGRLQAIELRRQRRLGDRGPAGQRADAELRHLLADAAQLAQRGQIEDAGDVPVIERLADPGRIEIGAAGDDLGARFAQLQGLVQCLRPRIARRLPWPILCAGSQHPRLPIGDRSYTNDLAILHPWRPESTCCVNAAAG